MSGVRKPTHWPDWRVDQLRQLAAKGLSSTEIARELDVSTEAVKRKARRAGVRFSSRVGGGNSTTWDDPARLARLVELVGNGWSSTVIARELGVSRGSVIARCKRDGLALQGRRGPKSVRQAAGETAASNVVPLRQPVREGDARPVPARDPMAFLGAVEGRCRMPLWGEGRQVAIEDKFYCGAPVAREGVSWCPACLDTATEPVRVPLRRAVRRELERRVGAW